MAIRISGLNSGLDTDSLVKELISAYSLKKESIVKQKTKLEWKQEQWKELNTKIYKLYSGTVSNLRYTSAYKKKATSSSDTTKATVTATNNAINGTQELEIKKLAKTGYLTGGNLKTTAGGKVSGNTTLADLGYNTSSGNVAVTTGGNTTNIEITKDTTINDFVNSLKDAGVSANFDEANQRLFISAKESGTENDFSLTGVDSNGMSALSSLGVLTNSKADTELYEAWKTYAQYDGLGNYSASLTKYHIEQVLSDMEDTRTENTTLADKNVTENDKIIELKALKVYAGYREDINMLNGDGANYIGNNLSDTEKARMQELMTKSAEDLDDNNGALRTELDDLKTRSGLSDELLGKYSEAANAVKTYEDNQTDSTNKDAVTAALGSGGVGFVAYAAEIDKDVTTHEGNITANNKKISENNEYLTKNKLMDQTTGTSISDKADELVSKVEHAMDVLNGGFAASSGATRIDAQDAIIILNNAEFKSSTNNITVNGLTITALQETAANEKITITTATDTQGVFDTIKNFLTEYNALVKEMDKLYSASSSKGYEPLTDDERSEMSEDEIEKWEQKIKDSLLRRDDTLSSMTSIMTSAMSKVYEINGKKYSLSSFGIKTTEYFSTAENEKNVFHIDGDPDDAAVSGKGNALMTMIQDDPEVVEEFFKQLTTGLYEDMDKRMKSTELRSSYTVYNDKKMADEIKQLNKSITKWDDKLEYYESFYYDKFTAMETALAKLQSNTNALSQLLGG